MLALRIIATVLLALSCSTCFFKNINVFDSHDTRSSYDKYVIIATLWGWLWRAFVIVAVWLI